MFTKLEEVVDRFQEVEGLLSDPSVMANQEKFRQLTKEHADLSELVEVYREYKKVTEEIEGNRELLRDADTDLREMAQAELPELEERREALDQQLMVLLLPRTPGMTRTSSWRFAPVRAATRRRFLPATFSACTAAMPTKKAGGWKS